MAEARVQDEEESVREAREAGGGARRNPARAHNHAAASERADRNKPEQRQSSAQGALSSIRAVIKRTSNRTASPTEQIRERRRPEITILAAEPLATNSWFAGASGAFPPPPPPAQPSWTGSVSVHLPPPSYEQVIREKSQEQNTQNPSSSTSSTSSSSPPPSFSSSSSSSCAPRITATIATQTEIETTMPQSCTRPSMRRPPMPPRPTFPFPPKPVEPVLSHMHSLIELEEPAPSCSTHTPKHHPSGKHCEVQTELAQPLEPSTLISPDSSQMTQSQAPAKQEVSSRPRPRPRSKALLHSVIKEEPQDQPMTREVKVQTLVRLKDDGTDSVFAGFTDTSLDIASNKYLQDLFDVFACEQQDDQSDQSEDGDEKESVPTENCLVSTEPSETITRPEPRPRTQKPTIAPKPFDPTLRVEETQISLEEQNKYPVPAPRPLVKQSSQSQQQDPSEEKTEPCRLRPPPRPLLSARKSGPLRQEDRAQPADVPFNPLGRSSDQDTTTAASEKPVDITSSSRGRATSPAKPAILRKPPGPTHTPKPIPTHTPAQDSVCTVSVSKSAPSPPQQATEGRLLPPRPPPIKSIKSAGSSPLTASTNQHSGHRGGKRGPPLPPRPKPGHPLFREYTKEKLIIVLDDTPRPTDTPRGVTVKPQDPASEQPIPQKSPELKKELETEESNTTSVRYRARFAFEGEDGELTFCYGDVVTLIEYINEEWGRGSLHGCTGLFPLNFFEPVQESPAMNSTPKMPAPAACVREGRTGRALYDFTPESEDELRLKAGDVVSALEEVDDEWFVGEFASQRGIIPKNFIQLL